MYVCICKGITDREIKACVERGASSVADLQRELGVATCCGRCEPCARELLGEADCPAEAT